MDPQDRVQKCIEAIRSQQQIAMFQGHTGLIAGMIRHVSHIQTPIWIRIDRFKLLVGESVLYLGATNED